MAGIEIGQVVQPGVFADYSSNNAQSIAASTVVLLNFEDVGVDSRSLVTIGASWKFTAPFTGHYQINTFMTFTSAAWTAGNIAQLYLYKNNAVERLIRRITTEATTTHYLALEGSLSVRLVQGDYIDIRAYHTRTAGAVALHSDGAFNWITIAMVSQDG